MPRQFTRRVFSKEHPSLSVPHPPPAFYSLALSGAFAPVLSHSAALYFCCRFLLFSRGHAKQRVSTTIGWQKKILSKTKPLAKQRAKEREGKRKR